MLFGLRKKSVRRKPVPSNHLQPITKSVEVDARAELRNGINDDNTPWETKLRRASHDVNGSLVLELPAAKADSRIRDNHGATGLMSLLKSSITDHQLHEINTVVKEILESRPELSTLSDWAGDTPLHLAAFLGATEVIQMLLKAGADVNAKNRLGQIAVHKCCSAEAAKVLVDAGANVELKDILGETAIERALACRLKHIVIVLLANASPTVLADVGYPILYTATGQNDVDTVRRLVEMGISLEYRHTESGLYGGDTPLHHAALHSKPEIVELLLLGKADIAARNVKGLTALHFATLSCCPQKMKLLLDAGASVEACDNGGRTPLHWAAMFRLPVDIIKVLLDAGASIETREGNGRTALHCAVLFTSPNCTEALSHIGIVNHIPAKGPWALYVFPEVRESQTLKIVEVLMDAGANILDRDEDGKTALHMASQNLKVSTHLVNILRKRSSTGDTALHWAVDSGDKEIVKMVLDVGTSPTEQNWLGETALQRAAAAKTPVPEIVKSLLDAGANVTSRDNSGRTALHIAAQYANPEVVKLLLDRNPDIEYRCLETSQTALHFSVFNRKYPETVTLLLAENADIMARDRWGNTALKRAKDEGFQEPLRILQDHMDQRTECLICCELRFKFNFRSDHLAKHEICKICLTTYIRTQVSEHGVTAIVCPGEDCEIVMSYDDIRQLSDEKTFSRFDLLYINRILEADENFRWCANQLCSAGQYVVDGAYVSYFTCTECNMRSCFDCRALAHPNLTCKEYQAFLIAEQTPVDTATMNWFKKNTKRCPCNRPIEKNLGCEHMTCTQCKAEWCWLCGADYVDIRKIGNTAHKRDCRFYA